MFIATDAQRELPRPLFALMPIFENDREKEQEDFFDSLYEHYGDSPNFNRFHQAAKSGSGPGDRRFKSSLPDQYFK